MLGVKRRRRCLFSHMLSVYHSSSAPGSVPISAGSAIMAIKDILKSHRTWEDGVGLLMGLIVGLSPWFYDEPKVPAVLLNSALTGLAVLALAQLELVHMRRWEEVAQLGCGLWLLASPFI